MNDGIDQNDRPPAASPDGGATRESNISGSVARRLWQKLCHSIVEPVERRQRRLEKDLASQADAIARLEAAADLNRSRLSTRLSSIDTSTSDNTAGIEAITSEIEDLRTANSSLLDEFGKLKGLMKDGIATLEGDAARARHHLAQLQEDHSALEEDVATTRQEIQLQLEELDRLEKLWADLHRDQTGLAAILSRFQREGPDR